MLVKFNTGKGFHRAVILGATIISTSLVIHALNQDRDIIMSKKIATLLLILATVWTLSVEAGTITQYTDRAIFDEAVGSTTLEDFLPDAHFPITSGILNDQTNEAGIVPGDIQSGVTYSTPIGTGNFFNIDAGGGYAGGMLDRVSGFEDLTIDFVDDVAAFGFDTNSLMGSQFTYVINFADGSSDTGTLPVVGTTAMQFFGFQSSATDIEWLTIRGNSNSFAFILDNFAFGGGIAPPPAPAVPVPTLSTYGLLLAFFGILLLTRRRFTNKAARLG